MGRSAQSPSKRSRIGQKKGGGLAIHSHGNDVRGSVCSKILSSAPVKREKPSLADAGSEKLPHSEECFGEREKSG